MTCRSQTAMWRMYTAGGIAAAYTAYWGRFTTDELPDSVMRQYGHSNVVISNNYMKDVGGDAITTMYLRPSHCRKQCVRWCGKVYKYNGLQCNGLWSGSQPLSGRGSAKMPYSSTMSALTRRTRAEEMATDRHGTPTRVMERSISIITATGIAVELLCSVFSRLVNSTFRYNISQNDMIGPLNIPSNPDAHIYNNTFYIAQGVPLIRPDMKNGAATIENNIIYYSGTSPKTETWYTNNKVTYNNNLYYNYSNIPARDTNAVNVSAGTPVLADPGTAPTTVSVDGTARPHSNPAQNTVFDGYKLVENSPAIDKGKVITDANGFAVEKDFFGNTITTTPEIGAAEYIGTLIATMYMTDEDSAEKVIYVPFTAKIRPW